MYSDPIADASLVAHWYGRTELPLYINDFGDYVKWEDVEHVPSELQLQSYAVGVVLDTLKADGVEIQNIPLGVIYDGILRGVFWIEHENDKRKYELRIEADGTFYRLSYSAGQYPDDHWVVSSADDITLGVALSPYRALCICRERVKEKEAEQQPDDNKEPEIRSVVTLLVNAIKNGDIDINTLVSLVANNTYGK